MGYMFYGATAFNQLLDKWDVSKVENMYYMFTGATAFNQSLNNWNVSSVVNMTDMFTGATVFNQSLDKWDVGKTIYMTDMFSGATAFNQSLAGWNLSSLYDMTSMLDNSGLDCNNYSETLKDWAYNSVGGKGNHTTPSGIKLGAATLKYSSGVKTAHDILTQAAGWTIDDDSVGACIVTPVTLLSFTAKAQANNTALLQWATTSETNNKGFGIQRSPAGASWIDLTFVNSLASGGNSSVQINYQFTDNSPLAGENYYRLKQVDLDGTASYSAVQELNFNNLSTALQVSPNPATDKVRVTLPAGASDNVPFKLVTADGKVILSGTMSNISGYGSISVSNVATGLYFLQIIINNTKQVCRLQVRH
jgi:surface protein